MSVIVSLLAPAIRRAREQRNPVAPPEFCPGSHVLVDEDSTDGNGVGQCETCRRPVSTDHVAGRLRCVEKHYPEPLTSARLAEMARDEATDDAVDACIEARP